MRRIEALGDYANVRRPIVYLGGLFSKGDNWQGQVYNSLESIQRGTVLDPRPPEDSDIEGVLYERWAMSAASMADVIAYWFPSSGAAQVASVFELGRHVGRYALGGGPRRLAVGVGEDYPFKGALEHEFTETMNRIDPMWGVLMATGMKDFLASVKLAVEYAIKVT